jgi:Putative transposase/Transposase zinc-binding domain
MVSEVRPIFSENARRTGSRRFHSPLGKTHHKACNGELPITCRNRHCPKCQGAAREKWLADRSAEMLPIPYFHVVFTLPQQLAPLALRNKLVVYGIFFRAVSETLLEVAADPKHLGAQIGFITVLHTWGQNLQHHPHVHCVISGGGLSPDRSRWIHSGDRFLLPVKVLSRVFRGKFLAFLKNAFRKGKLQFHGQLSVLNEKSAFDALLDPLYDREWVVYSKRPFGGPEHVLRYLANYTHRVAISNHRILSVADGNVTFRWKDYAHGNSKKVMTLSGCEFLRRLFLHTLPKGFVRIRQYGFLANRQRAALLPIGRSLLVTVDAAAIADVGNIEPADSLLLCPACHTGHLRTVERLPPCLRSRAHRAIPFTDSS